MENFFEVVPEFSKKEKLIEVLNASSVNIEKIISYGQITPIEEPYIQAHNEWVMVLKGNATLKLENKEFVLSEGEYLFIPKKVKHWVTYTANPTIWLAIHIKG